MRVKVFAAVLFAGVAAWSPTAFAQQVINGATPTAVEPHSGVTSGVSMTGQGGRADPDRRDDWRPRKRISSPTIPAAGT